MRPGGVRFVLIFLSKLYYGGLVFFPVFCYYWITTERVKMSRLYTIDELVTTIYEDNLNHFEFMENMASGDCDCALHNTMVTVLKYWEQ
jgi:hypothetical protein